MDEPSTRAFKGEIIDSINSELNKLNQIGIGIIGFQIKDENDTWADFLENCPVDKHGMVKEHAKWALKRAFDPPNSSILSSQIDERLREIEFRLLVDQS